VSQAGEQAATQVWELATDEQTGVAIPCPPRWQRVPAGDAVIALVEPYVSPVRRDFRANVTVTVERPPERLAEIAAYTTRMVDNAVVGLTDLHVIDLDVVEVAGHEGRRMLAGYRAGQYALALEQWWALAGGLGTTLSGTCAVESYPRASPIFELVACGLVLPRHAG
jgi:hypothetical protein